MRSTAPPAAAGLLRRWWDGQPEADKAILTATALVATLAAIAAAIALARLW
jgi:preprotein translocase subunit Sec61beta